MRFASVKNYTDYILENPECTSNELYPGVVMGRRLQDDLLQVVKFLLKHYVPEYASPDDPIKEEDEWKREIVLYKEN